MAIEIWRRSVLVPENSDIRRASHDDALNCVPGPGSTIDDSTRPCLFRAGGSRTGRDLQPLDELCPIAVVAPHPDDETLGCGGLISMCATAGVPLMVIAVTDGDASHPDSSTLAPDALAKLRRTEQTRALHVLSPTAPITLFRLGLADGGVARALEAAPEFWLNHVRTLLQSCRIRTVFVTAPDDQHADHQASFKLMESALAGREQSGLYTYSIWPPTGHVASEQEWRLDYTPLLDRKRHALTCFSSQLGQVVEDDPTGFQMSDELLARVMLPLERFTRVSRV